jgi:uncharacterized repeat protein (TIGR01451 family)
VILGVLTPIFTVTSSHTGSFTLGQTGAYTLSLTNDGPGVTSGQVTVSDTLPTGFTVAAMSGAGWTCTLATVSCMRSDPLGAGASYNAITLTVNLPSSSLATVTNTVNASGGAAIPASWIDSTSILAPPTTIQTTPTGLQFTIDSAAAQTAPQSLSLAPGTHTIAVTATQAGPVGTQYVFTGWSDSGAITHTITVEGTATTYTAAFKTQYRLTTASIPSVGGTVTPASGSFFDSGSSVTVTALPTSPYTLGSWGGAVTGASNPATVIMSAAQSVTANFSVPGYTCDLNGDGVTNILDVQMIIDEVLGLLPPTSEMSVTGAVNVADIQ